MTKERLLAIYAQALDNCKPYVELSIETIKTEVGYILCTDWHNPKEAIEFLSLCEPHAETLEPHWKNMCPHFGHDTEEGCLNEYLRLQGHHLFCGHCGATA